MDSSTFNEGLRKVRSEELAGLEAASRLDATVASAADAAFFESLGRAMLASRDQDTSTGTATIRACVETALDSVVIARQPELRAYILAEAAKKFDTGQMALLQSTLN